MLSFLDSAVSAGKIRYVGLSNHTGWQLQLAVSTARASGYQVPVSLQAQCSLATRQTELKMIPAARHNGLGILAWSPLASGFLTGKYERNEQRSPGTRAGQDHPLYQWVLDRPGVVAAIIGARNIPQLAGNLAAADVHLDADAMAVLDAASDPNPDPYPYGPFGSAQRDRTANGPEALGALVRAHAKGDHDGIHPAR
jgi:aryl-alcohol dehydrogenase-like predicted oxidoreductase